MDPTVTKRLKVWNVERRGEDQRCSAHTSAAKGETTQTANNAISNQEGLWRPAYKVRPKEAAAPRIGIAIAARRIRLLFMNYFTM
jgi:hypothetical protein